MATTISIEYPIPSSWETFEYMVWELLRRRWKDPEAHRFGSSGDPQHGVDVYGTDHAGDHLFVGVQCKRYESGKFNRKVIEEEILKAEEFVPPLEKYVFATTEKRKASLQTEILLINQERKKKNQFTIDILFWEDLCSILNDPENLDLLKKFYGSFFIPDPAGAIFFQEKTITDRELILFYKESLDRPAFEDKVHAQRDIESLVKFDNAIKDTITALNAGTLFDRETREILSRAKGKTYITNPKWRNDLEDIVDMLRSIRKTFQRLMSKKQQYESDYDLLDEMEANRVKVIERFSEICAEAEISPPHYDK